MPFELGLPEVIMVLVIALLFLGPKRLPEAGRSLGHAIREFRGGISGAADPEPPAPAPPSTTPAIFTPPGDRQATE